MGQISKLRGQGDLPSTPAAQRTCRQTSSQTCGTFAADAEAPSSASAGYLTTLTPQHELKTALWRETWLNNRPGTDPKYGLQGRKAKSFREFTGWLPEADLDELVIARNLRFSGKGVLSPPSFAVLKDCKWPHNVGPYTTADESGEEDEPASDDDAGG
jgi:hypothetical protein